jgi:hypothetical protein
MIVSATILEGIPSVFVASPATVKHRLHGWILRPGFGRLALGRVKGVRFNGNILDIEGVWDWDAGHWNGAPTKQSPYRTESLRESLCQDGHPHASAETLAPGSIIFGEIGTPMEEWVYHGSRFCVRNVV